MLVGHRQDQIKDKSVSFSTQDKHRDAFGVDYKQAWPTFALKVSPYEHVIIVDHRVLDIVFQNRISDLFGLSFICELGGMASHKCYTLVHLVFGLEVF